MVLMEMRNTIVQNRNVLGKRRCKRKEPLGAPSFCGLCAVGGAALMVALPHIDILDKLASLVNIHLLINMANVGIHGMG